MVQEVTHPDVIACISSSADNESTNNNARNISCTAASAIDDTVCSLTHITKTLCF